MSRFRKIGDTSLQHAIALFISNASESVRASTWGLRPRDARTLWTVTRSSPAHCTGSLDSLGETRAGGRGTLESAPSALAQQLEGRVWCIRLANRRVVRCRSRSQDCAGDRTRDEYVKHGQFAETLQVERSHYHVSTFASATDYDFAVISDWRELAVSDDGKPIDRGGQDLSKRCLRRPLARKDLSARWVRAVLQGSTIVDVRCVGAKSASFSAP
jgi:hypothetical protein